MRNFLLALALVALPALPRPAHAQYSLARFQLSLEPSMAGSFVGAINGLEIVAPDRGNTQTLFGLGAEFGVLATPLIEPGVGMNLFVFDAGGNAGTTTDFGFDPFLKLNLWVSPHVNPFFQPFAGFFLENAGQSTTFFDGGLYAGVELLVSSWGFKLFTGFEALVGGGTHTIGIPIRWAFTVYF